MGGMKKLLDVTANNKRIMMRGNMKIWMMIRKKNLFIFMKRKKKAVNHEKR
jgi:hypothetical protein